MKLAELAGPCPQALSLSFIINTGRSREGLGIRLAQVRLVSKPDRSHRNVQFFQDELNAAVGVVWFRDQGKTHQVQKIYYST